ncbi:MAG: RNA polymerase sigma factor [Bacteroidia bacterium]
MADLETILEQCKKNNAKAQAALYNLLAPKLLGVCLRYMEDRDEAEDVMQDTFVKIFTNIRSFKGIGSFEGWTKRIAANTALTALKKKNKIYFERNLQLAENIDFSEEEQQLLGITEIMNCMDALPMGYRTIINLFLMEEFSHSEIAEKLNISESTSRSQYARARQALMKLIKIKIEQEAVKKA